MLVTGRLRLSTIVFRLLHRQTGLHAHAIPATSSAAKCCASVHHASCSPASRNNRLRCRRETARRPASLDDFVAFRSREKNHTSSVFWDVQKWRSLRGKHEALQ